MHIDQPFFKAWPGGQGPFLGGEGSGESASEATQRYRTVWISDVHLGTPGWQAVALLEFLKHFESDHLFLVGDIIDGW